MHQEQSAHEYDHVRGESGFLHTSFDHGFGWLVYVHVDTTPTNDDERVLTLRPKIVSPTFTLGREYFIGIGCFGQVSRARYICMQWDSAVLIVLGLHRLMESSLLCSIQMFDHTHPFTLSYIRLRIQITDRDSGTGAQSPRIAYQHPLYQSGGIGMD